MIDNIRAKFYVNTITNDVGGETIEASPVMSGSEENKSFSKHTPSGSLKMRVTNENIFGLLQPGQEFYIDITPIKKD